MEGAMQCPYCNHEHIDGAVFCPMTGKAINACKKCQFILDADWKICPNCGSPVHEVDKKGEIRIKKQENKIVRTLKFISLWLLIFHCHIIHHNSCRLSFLTRLDSI
jgi:RNA polymerase subunit RPABC4/transcription elongation factor Spt4